MVELVVATVAALAGSVLSGFVGAWWSWRLSRRRDDREELKHGTENAPEHSADARERRVRRHWPLIVFPALLVGLVLFAAVMKFWPKDGDSSAPARAPLSHPPAPQPSVPADSPECRPSGDLIELRVEPTVGKSHKNLSLTDCTMATVMDKDDPSRGFGFRPVVEPRDPTQPHAFVRVDVFLVEETPTETTYLSSQVLMVGDEGTVALPRQDDDQEQERGVRVKVLSVFPSDQGQ